MRTKNVIDKDIEIVQKSYPKLRSICDSKGVPIKLIGELDVFGYDREYLDSFRVGISIPSNYPNGIPQLFELGNKIERIPDRHMYEDGGCCVDIDHELHFLASRGLHLIDFIEKKVIPFLTNQLFYETTGKFAGQEYLHGTDGVVQFYEERLKISNPEVIAALLRGVISNHLPGRNDLCLCGSTIKFKQCHYQSCEFLKSVNIRVLIDDLAFFKEKTKIPDNKAR